MKFEQRRYTLSPTVVPTGKPVTVTLKGHGDHYRFFDDIEYEVRLIPKEKRDYLINEDFDIRNFADECNIVDAYSKDGVLHFEYTFEGEQEWVLQLRAKGGQDKHFNRWRLYFKDMWNQKMFDVFSFDFRLYSVTPDLYELEPFRGDLHTHTEYSDGNDSPELFCANYRRFADFIAITDHYEYSSSVRAIESMKQLDTNFKVFPGEEVHVIPSGGRFHIVNFNGKASVNTKIIENYDGVKAEVFEIAKSFPELSERDAQELAWNKWITDEIRKVGGLSIYAHPYCTINHSYNCPTDITLEAIRRGFTDVYEILNCDRHQEETIQAALYYQFRNEGINLPIVGSTDSHAAGDYGATKAGCHSTIVFSKSVKDIPQAIMDLNSVALSHKPGQNPNIYGSFRLVKYASFLLDNFYPMHDELCTASSILMGEYFKGATELKPAIELAETRISAYKKSFFGK